MSSREARKDLNERYFYERVCSIANPHRYIKHIVSALGRKQAKSLKIRSQLNENIYPTLHRSYDLWDNPDYTQHLKAPLWTDDFETTFDKRVEHIMNVIKSDLTCILLILTEIEVPNWSAMRAALISGMEAQAFNLFTIGGFTVTLDDSVSSFSTNNVFVSRTNKGEGDIGELTQIISLNHIYDIVLDIVRFLKKVEEVEKDM